MRLGDLIKEIEGAIPPAYAQDWDNVGLLVGDADTEVTRVYLALDATAGVIEEAKAFGAQLILTHHPMIFKGMKRVTADHFIGRKILMLAQSGIACYAMHTNFDVMGMADAMARRLELHDSQALMAVCPSAEQGTALAGTDTQQGIGRIGSLPREMTLKECAAFVKNKLEMPFVTVSGDADRTVRRAAVSPGSGRSMCGYAVAGRADVLITGDIGHHEALDAKEQGLCIIDAGHYGTEKIFMEYMERWLSGRYPQLACACAKPAQPFFVV